MTSGLVAPARRPGVVRVVRDLPRHCQVLIVGVAVNRTASFVQVFLVLYLTTERGWTATAAGTSLTAFGVGAVLGVLCGGVAAARLGCRTAIVISMLGAGLCVGALPHAPDVVSLVGLAGLSGALAQLYRPAAMTLLAAAVPAERLVLVAAGYRFGLNVGAMLTPVAGAVLAARSYDLLFTVDAATAIAFGVVAWGVVPGAVPAHDGSAASPGPAGRVAAPWRDARFLLVAAGLLLIAAVEVQYVATLPLEVVARGLSTSAYAGMVALNGLLVIGVEPVLTGRLAGWPPRRTLAIGVCLIGLGVSAYGVTGPLPVLVAATALWTLGEMVAAPPAASYPALAAPAPARSRYLALAAGAQGAGYAIGPLLGTALYPRTPGLLWAGCALVGVAAAACCWLGARASSPAGDGGRASPAGGTETSS